MASPRLIGDGIEDYTSADADAGDEHGRILLPYRVPDGSDPSVTVGQIRRISLVDLPVARPRRHLELSIGGVRMHHVDVPAVTAQVAATLAGTGARPLAIGSVNLDHMFHFAARRSPAVDLLAERRDAPKWLMLIDGSPVARRARTCTGQHWPRLTGADLLPDLLDAANAAGARVGFLGGSTSIEAALRRAVAKDWPEVRVAGVWTPPRAVVDDPSRSAELAEDIAQAGVDLLVVGLGKPRQEAWIAEHGVATRAKVLTAFGAAAGFLAGSAPRAPIWMRRIGIEWLYRLAREPRRLWRRYLVQGPVALRALHGYPATIDYVAELGGDPPR